MKLREEIWRESTSLVEKKGHDYNKIQQNAGDTLFNLRVPHLLGIVSSPTKTCLTHISEKLMRLCSLDDEDPKVKGESIKDTVEDLINYTTYFYAFHEEKKKNRKPTKFEDDFGTPVIQE